MRTVFVTRASARDIILTHLRTAENCHKNPENLAGFINALYGIDCPSWILIEAPTRGVVEVLQLVQYADVDKIKRYREKLFRLPAPPAVVVSAQDEVYVLNGIQVILAQHTAKRERCKLYIDPGGRKLLDS